jgi:hypothetical protein
MDIGNLAPLFGVLGLFAAFSWTVWVIVDSRRRRERLRLMTDFHNRLLEKIGSAREFGEFLQTDGGTRFLDSLVVDRSRPGERILRAVAAGIVLSSLSLAMLVLGWVYGLHALSMVGALVFSIGVGFLIAASVSYRLSRAWGLMKHD